MNFTKERVRIQWAGYGQVCYQKYLLRACIESGIDFDRVFILTGQDYPLLSNEEINNVLSSDPNKEYIKGLNLTALPKGHVQRDKVMVYYFFLNMTYAPRIIQKILWKGSRVIMKMLPFRKKPYVLVDGEKWNIYFSSSYMCITMALARYVYNEMIQNEALQKYFKTAFAPEELVIPTIIFNSPFKHHCELYEKNQYDGLITLSKITYFNYGKIIQVFALKDYQELKKSGRMFARKFAAKISDELMDKLDKEHGIS